MKFFICPECGYERTWEFQTCGKCDYNPLEKKPSSASSNLNSINHEIQQLTTKTTNNSAWDSDEFKILRSYWKEKSRQYWDKRIQSSAVCDSCNTKIFSGQGYLRGSHLDCEDCCREMLDESALIASINDPNYFGPGEIASAMMWANSHERA